MGFHVGDRVIYTGELSGSKQDVIGEIGTVDNIFHKYSDEERCYVLLDNGKTITACRTGNLRLLDSDISIDVGDYL